MVIIQIFNRINIILFDQYVLVYIVIYIFVVFPTLWHYCCRRTRFPSPPLRTSSRRHFSAMPRKTRSKISFLGVLEHASIYFCRFPRTITALGAVSLIQPLNQAFALLPPHPSINHRSLRLRCLRSPHPIPPALNHYQLFLRNLQA